MIPPGFLFYLYLLNFSIASMKFLFNPPVTIIFRNDILTIPPMYYNTLIKVMYPRNNP